MFMSTKGTPDMNRDEVTLETAKGYATEANLRKALERTGLDTLGARYIVCRKADGKWTAVFMITEYLNKRGGYVFIASQHGFVSV
jgi:hypothetical protein